MSKIAKQKALEAYPVRELKDNFGTRDINICMREACIQGYDQALSDIKQRVKEIIEHQEKEWTDISTSETAK